jgi:hypothetical protein
VSSAINTNKVDGYVTWPVSYNNTNYYVFAMYNGAISSNGGDPHLYARTKTNTNILVTVANSWLGVYQGIEPTRAISWGII